LEQKEEEEEPEFFGPREFFLSFLAFLVVPFSLSPLETKQHPDQKQTQNDTTKKEKHLLQSSVVFLDSSSCRTFQSQRRIRVRLFVRVR
tara:strand:+ start:274 stop:540 length:267 start_codon:yes stop_codon:yes gene_type:complete